MGLKYPRINATVSGSTVATAVTVDDLEVDSGTLSIDADNNRVGINTTSPAKTLGVDGDLHFQPTAISTSHITTAGSLDIRADNNIKIGTDGADSIRLGRVNSTAAKVHLRSGTDNDVVISNSKVGIGTDSPSEALQVVGNVTLSGELDAATLDISGNADIDGTLEADAITVDGTALNEYIADTVGAMVTSNTETGITVTYEDGDNTLDFAVGTLNQDTTGTAAIATTVTVADESSDTSCNVLFTTAATGNLAPKSGTNLTFNSSDGTLTATNFAGTLTTASQTNITGVGTISTGTWQGTAIASAYLDADTAHLSGTQTFTGAKTFSDDVVISGTTPKLTIGDAGAEDTMLVFDGNAADYRIGIDDGTDTLEIGKGSAHGTTPVIKIDSSTNLQVMHNSAVADGEYSGDIAMFTAGEDLTAGEVCYFKSDGKMWKAVATAAATSRCVAMATASISADAMGVFLLKGFARFNSEFPTWTVGGALYTPEAETSNKNVPEQTAPDTDGDFVQIIGWAVSADAIWFDPDSTVVEVA
tara:strand:- start:4201 stop:5796 length:1596 start_codon:yes stop_codon:yes gene_type:complete